MNPPRDALAAFREPARTFLDGGEWPALRQALHEVLDSFNSAEYSREELLPVWELYYAVTYLGPLKDEEGNIRRTDDAFRTFLRDRGIGTTVRLPNGEL